MLCRTHETKRLGIVVALVLILVTVTFVPAEATDGAEPPVLLAQTTFTFDGTSGTSFRVEQDLGGQGPSISYGTLALGEGTTYAFLSVGRRTCLPYCNLGGADSLAPTGPRPLNMQENLRAGDYDIYVIADGPATLTIDHDRLPAGQQEIHAEGVFDYEFHQVELECETPTCNLLHGGMTFDVPSDYALVSVYGRALIRGGSDPFYEPGNTGGTACVHPQFPGDEYYEPADGCDLIFDDPEGLRTSPTLGMVASTQVNGPGFSHHSYSAGAAPGPVYVGTRLQATGGVQNSPEFDAFAYMITSRVRSSD